MADETEYERGLKKAFRMLAVKARSEKEIRAGLHEKKIDRQVADRIVGRLGELKYLDDADFARQWVRRLAIEKLYGDRRIEAGLREKGIDETIGKQALAEIRREFPERDAVRRAIKKKLKDRTLRRADLREVRSVTQHLLGRGFAPGLVFEMIKETQEGYRDDNGQPD